ncbi:esterase family protein [Agreia sp. COWG]|uniref:alpha/beta hydrolase n=1 Tax=Agreia sp. COWG TaxID=2773266 RepID=UPI0019274B38|nr:alpha/beta hydrolase-fold protein [Agreia sp. COWG]CAD5991151.1 conserved membrane protein of unknown function [Agreia sp. COWG]
MNSLLDISITSGPFVIVVYGLALAAIVLLVLRRPGRLWHRGRWRTAALVSAVAGALVGLLLTFILSDWLDLFGAELTTVVRVWIALGFAGIGVAVASMVRASWLRVVAASLAAVLFLATAAMTVNLDFGQYPTVRSALGISAVVDESVKPLPDPAAADSSLDTWVAPSGMPTKGTLTSVTIPATKSGFAARPAVVYLPPAALTADPPKLPVLVMLSGQPGTPQDPLVTEKLGKSLDEYAAAHQGLAPIVVSPDQLGDPSANPMCVDSKLGNSATYLTVDVPTWIKANLGVIDDPHYWGIGGLSQGGTCAMQFGTGYPNLFSVILNASSEQYPRAGNPQASADAAFGGSLEKYQAAWPENIMKAHGPYPDTFAVFGVGSEDDKFMPGVKKLYADATAAGMTATYLEAPGSAHDVTTWTYVFSKGLVLIADHWNLNR